jgi:hypothetical protein
LTATQTGDSFTTVMFITFEVVDSFKKEMDETTADERKINKLGTIIDCLLINKDTCPLHFMILSFVMDTNKFIPRNIPIVNISTLSEKNTMKNV